MTAAAHLLIALLRAYKRCVSPLLPPSCRFEPTCSVYAMDAIRRRGASRGAILALRRLVRCRPGKPGGYDPVPLDDEDCAPETAAYPDAGSQRPEVPARDVTPSAGPPSSRR